MSGPCAAGEKRPEHAGSGGELAGGDAPGAQAGCCRRAARMRRRSICQLYSMLTATLDIARRAIDSATA